MYDVEHLREIVAIWQQELSHTATLIFGAASEIDRLRAALAEALAHAQTVNADMDKAEEAMLATGHDGTTLAEIAWKMVTELNDLRTAKSEDWRNLPMGQSTAEPVTMTDEFGCLLEEPKPEELSDRAFDKILVEAKRLVAVVTPSEKRPAEPLTKTDAFASGSDERGFFFRGLCAIYDDGRRDQPVALIAPDIVTLRWAWKRIRSPEGKVPLDESRVQRVKLYRDEKEPKP